MKDSKMMVVKVGSMDAKKEQPNLIKVLKSKSNLNSNTLEKRIANYQPSWMYRND